MQANTVELRDWLRRHRDLNLPDYEALRRWSVEHVSDFWQALWDYFALASPTPHERALVDRSRCGDEASWTWQDLGRDFLTDPRARHRVDLTPASGTRVW